MPPIPPVTKALMLICTALFCLEFFTPLSLWFALWPVGSGRFAPWQLLSYAFLHSGTMHLFFNMFGLWMSALRPDRVDGRDQGDRPPRRRPRHHRGHEDTIVVVTGRRTRRGPPHARDRPHHS